MSRIESGKLRLDVQTVDLSSIIDAAVESVQPAADAKGIRIQRLLDPAAGPIQGDPSRLQQVVWNLLTNAIKFTPRGGRVEVVLKRVESQLQITVSDTGQGIPADFIPHLFERFRQADPSTTRSVGGLGLGLAIVKHLIELHGGTVHAASAGKDQGAMFTIELPVAIARPASEPERSRTAAGVGAGAGADTLRSDEGASLAGLRVLIVEDDPDARRLVRVLLERQAAQVMAAASAEEALEVLDEFAPDVLVSDIGMPGTDGYQFIRQVRQRSVHEGGTVPALALTAFARSEDRRRALIAGYEMHLAKPIEPSELIVSIAALARARRRRTGESGSV
jgi:CheY-like chemotaxis protein/two-component sensor histidine kinase